MVQSFGFALLIMTMNIFYNDTKWPPDSYASEL